MANVYKRGSSYWGRVTRSGKEYRRSLKTKDRRTAEKRLQDWIGELERIAWGEKPRKSFADLAERFILEHLPTLKPKSAIRYGVSIKNLNALMGHMMVDEITRSVLSDFEVSRRNDGVTAATVRRDLACLSSMLTSAMDWEWIDMNPVPTFLRARSRRGLKESPPRTRYLSAFEEKHLLAHTTPAVQLAIELAIDTGLRREELFSLTWKQIDLSAGVIKLGTNTKSGKPREVPILQRARTNLGTHPRHFKSPYVLRHDDGRRLQNMQKGFKSACRRARITDLKWHDLRRTAGCRLLQDYELSMEEVSKILGHSSVVVTEQRYAFLDMERTRNKIVARTKLGTGATD
ncbi:tyrosine-type recombinase/integrase [Cohaesibacter marisflavi]|uniref:tyrosine-type recombinase/integrase n=1 Tax=Cohaesibacter marisflavi TaxID=655353 RepID=UPI0029C9397B|nr:tyrosine-type recombinase/integrase [Cohaesibacter marisflavi]